MEWNRPRFALSIVDNSVKQVSQLTLGKFCV